MLLWTEPNEMSKKKELKVIDLFAGVGGFRLGLEKVKDNVGNRPFKIVWSNQWEPAHKKRQFAFEIYYSRFNCNGDCLNKDISTVNAHEIPDHDVLVAGFPCQDYSVARTLNQAVGIIGKKGVLWWQIHRILSEKSDQRPSYLILENVDRLLRSPAGQRGRDFAIILASLNDLGYAVEWKVINAADYGFPQKRRRVFIVAYHKRTASYTYLSKRVNRKSWLINEGVITKAFPIQEYSGDGGHNFDLEGDLTELTRSFGKDNKGPEFLNTGLMIDREVLTIRTIPYPKRKPQTLGDILLDDRVIPEEFFVNEDDLPKWKYLKGAKSINRKKKDTGHLYTYDEGSMPFPDPLNSPSRTIVTGEGGTTPSRFKHIIKTSSGRFRRLVPNELERLNGFPLNHTYIDGITPAQRAFLMGNALVVGIVERLGKELAKRAIN